MVRRKNSSRHGVPQRPRRANVVTEVLVNKQTRRKLVIQEIRRLQKSIKLIIPKLSFARLVKETLDILTPGNPYRMQKSAVEALQEAVEMYMVQFFQDCMLLSLHAKRVTLHINDFRLTRRLRGRSDVVNH